VGSAIALPVAIVSIVEVEPPEMRWVALCLAALGCLAAYALRIAARLIAARREGKRDPGERTPSTVTVKIAHESTQRPSPNPYRDLPPGINRLMWRATVLFLLTAFVYALVGRLGSPAGVLANHVPAAAYIMIIIMLLAWALSMLSFVFDRSRAPGVGLLIASIILLQLVFPSTHYFPVSEWPSEQPVPDGLQAIGTRAKRVEQRPMVVVAASGGGITASYWTAVVLQGLHRNIGGFGDRVALTSSVSGGGVATMLYADRFSPESPPNTDQLAAMVDQAGEQSLDAVGWGLAYPDFARLLLWYRKGLYDRGWAIEQRWSRFLEPPDQTLGGWAAGVEAGWRPIQIFNATLQESGGRVVFAPASLGQPPSDDDAVLPPRMRLDLEESLPGGDLQVVTAARLSATFPFVSPQARPAPGTWTSEPGLHCADGGYFDTSGLYTALEVMGDYLDTVADGPHPERIAIVEIRAASPADEIANAKRSSARGGLINSVLGPLNTLYNARVATQIARTGLEFPLVQSRWAADHGVTAERFVFHLTGKLPLSWKLTRQERSLIQAHWPDNQLADDATPDLEAAWTHNRGELERLRRFLLSPNVEPTPAPPDPAAKAQDR
jgi:hypothetical protein